MFFKKSFFSLFISPLIFSSTFSFAQANVDVNSFISDYDETLKIMIQSYHEEVKDPLSAKIFDISKPLYYNFLKNSSRREFKDHFLAMRFYNDFRINNQQTNFCFILYDNNKINQLDIYLNQTFPKPNDAINYLVAHELGHCIAAHQRVLGNISPAPDEYKEEQIADMFAIGFFLSRNEKEQALAIIKFLKRLPKEDIHSNVIALENFYNLFNEAKPSIKNVAELFHVSYEYYLKINP